MMTKVPQFTDWFALVGNRINECSEYVPDEYGTTAHIASYWNGEHGDAEVSSSVVYDTKTLDVYELEVFDGKAEVAYVWTVDGVDRTTKTDIIKYIHLPVLEDFMTKAEAILNGKEYDTRVQIELDMTEDEIHRLMEMAHLEDITLNQLVEKILWAAIEKENPVIQTSWPHAPTTEVARKLASRYTWYRHDDDFIGVWNTIRVVPYEEDSSGQFAGDIVCRTYDISPIYTYTAVWYDKTLKDICLPDEITKEDK